VKIEVDTELASKDELKHLAAMLQALSGEADRSISINSPSTQSSSTGSTPSATKNIFDDPAPAGGLFSMFGDPSPSTSTPEPASFVEVQPVEPVQSAAVQNTPDGDMFSIFSSSPSSQGSGSSSTVSGTSGSQSDDKEEETDERTSVSDILDDDSIVPY